MEFEAFCSGDLHDRLRIDVQIRLYREAFIFLQIPESPETAYYYLSRPNLDVGKTTEWKPDSAARNRLHLTAIGQILIFILRAMSQKPRDQEW